MLKLLAVAVVALLVGGWLAWWWKPAPPPGPPNVVTDTLWMEKERVAEKPSLGQRLTTAVAKPTQTRRADTSSSAGRAAVAAYCPPARQVLAQRPADSGQVLVKPAATLPDFQGRRVDSRLTLYSTLNDGRRWSADYTARGRISWQSSGDSVLVRGDRLWVRLLRGGVKCAPAMGATGLTGFVIDQDNRLRGLAVGALSTAVGCLF